MSVNKKYFAEERRNKIIEYIKRKDKATVEELAQDLSVSPSTVRNDLNLLQDYGLIRRTHGGAMTRLGSQVSIEPAPSSKQDLMKAQKEAIAKVAAAYVDNGDTIAIMTSTTTMAFARSLTKKHGLTIVLNDIQMASWLETNTEHNIFLLGGLLRRNFHYVSFSEELLPNINIDKIFFSCNGFDPQKGATIPDFYLASNVRTLIRKASKSFLLCDSSKFGHVSFAQIAATKDITRIIIDKHLDEDQLRQFDENDLERIDLA